MNQKLFFFSFFFPSSPSLFFFLTFSPGERISREGGSMGERRENVGQILLDGVINGGGKRVKRLIRSVRGFRWMEGTTNIWPENALGVYHG